MRMAIGKLHVIAYFEPHCDRHKKGWALKVVPATQCPYYLCLVNGNERIHRDYVSVAKRRHPNWETDTTNTYAYFMQLKSSIERDGYLDAKAREKPMRVYKGTAVLEEGHHRAAILAYLMNAAYEVEVDELDKADWRDGDYCDDPCGG